jgi:hypothetical protein
MNDVLMLLLGVPVGYLGSKLLELHTRSRAHRVAADVEGGWAMYDYVGSTASRRVEGAYTEIELATSQFSPDSCLLTVRGKDPGGSLHDGFLAIDPHCPFRAIRSLRYQGTDEVVDQQITVNLDQALRKVTFPAELHIPANKERGYSAHVLRQERRKPAVLRLFR